MASWASVDNQTLSTSGGNLYEVAYTSWATTMGSQASNGMDLSSERTVPVTFASAGNQKGIFIHLGNIYNSTGTLTIKLVEGSTTRTTNTFTIGTDINNDYYLNIVYLPLTTYAVTTAASTWYYKISCTDTNVTVYGTDTTTESGRYISCVLDNAVSHSAGDNCWLADDVTFTIDSDWSTGHVYIGAGATIDTGGTPTSAITWTFGATAKVFAGYYGTISIGTEANPVSASNKFTIDFGHAGSVFDQAIYTNAMRGDYVVDFDFLLYGPTDDGNLADRISAVASSGQADVVTENDMSGEWAVGDYVAFCGKDVSTTDNVEYQIDSISGTTITLDNNLDHDVLKGAAIMNRSRRDECGIELTYSTGGDNVEWSFKAVGQIVIQGVYSEFAHFAPMYIHRIGDSYVNTLINYISGSGFSTSGFLDWIGITYATHPNYGESSTIKNVIVYTTTNLTSFGFFDLQTPNTTVSKFYGKGHNGAAGGVFYVAAFGCTFEDVVVASGATNSPRYTLLISGYYGHTFTNCGFFGQSHGVLFSGTVSNITFDNCQLEAGGTYNLDTNGATNIRFINGSSIGYYSGAGTAEIYIESDVLAQLNLNNSFFGSGGVNNLDGAADGSYVKINKRNQDAGDHHTYWRLGETQSSGDGLTDTTVHTSGTGKFAIRLEPTSSSELFDSWSFDVPTSNIKNKTMTVACWVKINSATYYAGTHTNPTLRVDYDDGTEVTSVASDSTDWQQLSVTFTPATTFGQITVSIEGKTDATSTNAYFYVDDFSVLLPESIDLGGLDLWANALPVTPPISTGITAAQVWDVQTSTLTGTGTIGKQIAAIKNQKLVIGQVILDETPS